MTEGSIAIISSSLFVLILNARPVPPVSMRDGKKNKKNSFCIKKITFQATHDDRRRSFFFFFFFFSIPPYPPFQHATPHDRGHAGPLLSRAPPLDVMNSGLRAHHPFLAHSEHSLHSSSHWPPPRRLRARGGMGSGWLKPPSNFATRIHFTAVHFIPRFTGHAPAGSAPLSQAHCGAGDIQHRFNTNQSTPRDTSGEENRGTSRERHVYSQVHVYSPEQSTCPIRSTCPVQPSPCRDPASRV